MAKHREMNWQQILEAIAGEFYGETTRVCRNCHCAFTRIEKITTALYCEYCVWGFDEFTEKKHRGALVMAKSTRELKSFPPEVLAEFIQYNVPMLSAARASKVFADLIHIEARQRLDKINKELDRLIAKGKSLHGVEHIKECLEVQAQIDVLWKEQKIAMDIAFPPDTTLVEKTNGQPT